MATANAEPLDLSKLPLELRLEILKKADPIILIEYSMISRSEFDSVKKLEFKGDVDIDLERAMVRVRIEGKPEPVVFQEHGDNGNTPLSFRRFNKSALVRSYVIGNTLNVQTEAQALSRRRLFHFSDLFLGHCFNLFQVQKVTVGSPFDLSDFENCIFLRKIVGIQDMKVTDDRDNTPIHQIVFVMKSLKVPRLIIEARNALEKYDEPLTIPHLDVTGDWFTFNSILNMTCNNFYTDRSFSAEEVNQLLHRWLSGGLNNLQFFQCPTEFHHYDNAAAINGIHFGHWPERPDFVNNEFVYPGGYDMQRADGRRGAVWFEYQRIFFFRSFDDE